MIVSPTDCLLAIERILKAGLVPFIKGSPGTGKSNLMAQIAKMFELKLIDNRLSTADPTDLNGFPAHTQNSTRMGYLPPEGDLIPLAHDPIPQGFNGWLLFFDELTAADRGVQAASYKVMLDRMVGKYHIHPNCLIAAAGNLDTDKAIVNKMSTAMQSRLVHLTLEVSNEDWQQYALDQDYDYRIRAFLKWRKPLLQNFKPDHTDDTFACPRTWEFASKLIKNRLKLDSIDTAVLIGTLGNGPAIEFKSFTDIFERLPSYEEIANNPLKVDIPNEPSILHALAALIAHEDHLKTIDKVMPFIERLPVEFQVWALRDAIRKDASILNNPAVDAWKIKFADRLY